MTVDLQLQLAGYGEQLQTHVAPFAIDEIVGEAPSKLRPVAPRRPGWATALVAALVVLLLVGGAALAIRLLMRQEPVVDEPDSGQTISVVHEEGVAGAGLSMVLDPGGNPVLAYSSAGSIWVARCDDVACSSGIERTELASFTELWDSPIAVAVLEDGTTAISYVEPGLPSTGDQPAVTVLKYARAGEVVAIEEGSTTVRNGGRGMAVAGNGLPVLAYYTWTGERGEVVILACGDASCAVGNTRTVVDVASGFSGLDLTVDADGNPVVAYAMWEGENSLRLARCADPTCASGATITTLSDQDTHQTRLALDSSDHPVVFTGAQPRVEEPGQPDPAALLITCGDPMCDSRTATSIPQPAEFLSAAQLVLKPDDVPVLTWILDGQLWIAECGDRACTEPTMNNLGIKASGDQSTAIGTDGNPIIAFATGSDVALLRCADPACKQPTAATAPTSPSAVTIGGEHWSVTTLATEGVGTWPPAVIVLDPAGVPLVVYSVDVGRLGPEGEIDLEIGDTTGNLVVAKCTDPACLEE